MSQYSLPGPYLIFLGDLQTWINAKTGQGLVDWCPEKCLGQFRLPECTVDLGVPDMDLNQAIEKGVKSMVIGLAPVGGNIKPAWIPIFKKTLEAGINIINGLHVRLGDIKELAETEKISGARVIQVRTPPANLPVGTGKKRSGKRVLMVGTDCGVGKKYTALCLYDAMKKQGMDVTFRATGQTGIMISGGGIPMDAVKSDFISGAAEMLSPVNHPNHWDVIEGQGALHHPGYAAVSLGILHGSQPDAFVLCHEATRDELDGFTGFVIGDLRQRIEEAICCGRVTNPDIQCIGISVNTSLLADQDRSAYLTDLAEKVQLPCIDPMRQSLAPIIDRLLKI